MPALVRVLLLIFGAGACAVSPTHTTRSKMTGDVPPVTDVWLHAFNFVAGGDGLEQQFFLDGFREAAALPGFRFKLERLDSEAGGEFAWTTHLDVANRMGRVIEEAEASVDSSIADIDARNAHMLTRVMANTSYLSTQRSNYASVFGAALPERLKAMPAGAHVAVVTIDATASFVVEGVLAAARERPDLYLSVVMINPAFVVPVPSELTDAYPRVRALTYWTLEEIRANRTALAKVMRDPVSKMPPLLGVTREFIFEGRKRREDPAPGTAAYRKFASGLKSLASHVVLKLATVGQGQYRSQAHDVEGYLPKMADHIRYREQREVEGPKIYPVVETRGPLPSRDDRMPIVTGRELRLARISHRQTQALLGAHLFAEFDKDRYDVSPTANQTRVYDMEWTENGYVSAALPDIPFWAYGPTLRTYMNTATMLEIPVAFPDYKRTPDDRGVIPRLHVKYYRIRHVLFMLAFLAQADEAYAAPKLLLRTLPEEIQGIKRLGAKANRGLGVASQYLSGQPLKERIAIANPRTQAALAVAWRAIARTYALIRYCGKFTCKTDAATAVSALREMVVDHLRSGPKETQGNLISEAFRERFDAATVAPPLVDVFDAAVAHLEPDASPEHRELYYLAFMPKPYFARLQQQYNFQFAPKKPTL